jgi:hypothetical protein
MISTKITREAGKLMLVINAKDFHDTLDSLGVAHDGTMYLHRPTAETAVANRRFEISTDCLLKRQYPAKFELSGVWSTPPTNANLTALCGSALPAARKILDHYQPIDISIEIQKKIVR